MKLNFEKSGNSVSEDIVFLHGLGGRGQLWRPIAVQLENEFQVFCIDQRGHGKSFVTQDDWNFHSRSFALDLLETSVNFKDKFTLVGHSMGARTAVSFAEIAPEKIHSLVLVDLGVQLSTGGGFGKILMDFLQKLDDEYESRDSVRKALENAPDLSIAQYLMAVLEKNEKGKYQFTFQKKAVVETIKNALGESILPSVRVLSEKKIPILWLRGARSSVFLKEDYTKLSSEFRNSSVFLEEIQDAGHGLPFEKRLIFTARLQSWIQEVKNFSGF